MSPSGPSFFPIIKVVLLLFVSNIFMNFAWYGHLRYRDRALAVVILSAWGLAFFEYCFQVPANRLGSHFLSTAQLKIIQEAIALLSFAVFSSLYLRERLTRYDLASFALAMAAVAVSVSQPSPPLAAAKAPTAVFSGDTAGRRD